MKVGIAETLKGKNKKPGYRIVQTAARQSPGMEPFSSLAVDSITPQRLVNVNNESHLFSENGILTFCFFCDIL